MRVATFFPFQTTYYLNGHSFIEQELNRAKIGFRKDDNAFLAVDDVTALQAAADKLQFPAIIRERLDYWTLILGPKFSVKERQRINLSRFIRSRKSNTAATSSSNVTSRSTSCSSEAVRTWALAADIPQDLRHLRAATIAGSPASSPPSSTGSSMAIMSFVPTSSTPS